MTTIETAIAAALPHEPGCPGDSGKCICGVVGKRNVLYMHVNQHVSRLTRGRVYLNEAPRH